MNFREFFLGTESDMFDIDDTQEIQLAASNDSHVPPNFASEVGVTSVNPALIEYVPELRTRMTATRTYDMMIRNDAQVRATLRATKIPILGGQWFIEPFDQSNEAKDIAEFVEDNLMLNYNMSWTSFLEEVLRMEDYGCSIFEKVWEYADWTPRSGSSRKPRRMLMLRKLAPRSPFTIKEFVYDVNGGPNGIVQILPATGDTRASISTGREVNIPIEKLVIFTYDKVGGNLEGQSLLRTAYKHWYYKEKLYKIDAIQKERHGLGVPDIGLPPGYTDNDKAFAAELGRNIRTNDKAYIVRPPGWEVGFAEVKGNLVNALESAQEHDLMLARNVLVQFINAGAGASGGAARSSTATMADLFLKSLRHLANLTVDTLNLYCVRQLVNLNFNTRKYPTVGVRQLGDTKDLQTLSAALLNAQTAGLITGDSETEDWLRDQFGMPDKQGDRPPGADFPQQQKQSKNETTGNIGKSPTSGT